MLKTRMTGRRNRLPHKSLSCHYNCPIGVSKFCDKQICSAIRRDSEAKYLTNYVEFIAFCSICITYVSLQQRDGGESIC